MLHFFRLFCLYNMKGCGVLKKRLCQGFTVVAVAALSDIATTRRHKFWVFELDRHCVGAVVADRLRDDSVSSQGSIEKGIDVLLCIGAGICGPLTLIKLLEQLHRFYFDTTGRLQVTVQLVVPTISIGGRTNLLCQTSTPQN